MYADFTSDPNNPHFIESLGYAHDRGTPKYTTYMNNAGLCMVPCPKDQLDFYSSQYSAKTDWYKAHKNDATATTSPGAPATGSANTTSPGGPATTTTSGAVTQPSNAATAVSASGALVGAAALAGAVAALF